MGKKGRKSKAIKNVFRKKLEVIASDGMEVDGVRSQRNLELSIKSEKISEHI